jgi:hypothetical protein
MYFSSLMLTDGNHYVYLSALLIRTEIIPPFLLKAIRGVFCRQQSIS